jgi:DNA-binding YbaB/EbfC family protein
MQNIEDIMRMAQNVQQQLADAQGKLDEIEVEGAAGGGMVRIRCSAKGRIIGVSIDPSLLNVGDKEMLEDLVAAAFNDARAKADTVANEQMQKMSAGLPLPPGFKLPF